jgi:parvulin-like peptidyl-prolyl isomerase
VPELLVQDRLDEIVARRFDGDRTRFQAALAEERKTLESLREEIREEITVSLLRRQEVGDRIAVTPAQVREAYEERRASYFTPERVRLRLISLNREGLPEDLLEKKVASVSAALAAKRDFAEVAKDYSDFLPEKAGELGVMVKSDMRADFRKAILGLSAGQTAGPIPGDKEIAFLQVVEILPEVTKSLESVQAELERELRRKAEEELYKGWISRLRLKYPVVIYPGRS